MATITNHLAYKLDNLFQSAPPQSETVKAVAKILFEFDPCRLNFGDNYFEYIGESKEITAQWHSSNSPQEIKNLIYDIMKKWLGDDWMYNKSFTSNRFDELSEVIYSLKLTTLQ